MLKSIVGPVINSRGMIYGPLEKLGVMFLFGRFLDDFGFLVEEINPIGPKAVLRRPVRDGLERIEAAFALNSSEAKASGYLDDCSLLICWRDDWGECPCEVLELKPRVFKITPARHALDRIIGKTHSNGAAGNYNAPREESEPLDESPEEGLH